MAQQFFLNLPNTTFRENPSNRSQVVTYVQTDRRTDGLSDFSRRCAGLRPRLETSYGRLVTKAETEKQRIG
jgi:hypothetical protein